MKRRYSILFVICLSAVFILAGCGQNTEKVLTRKDLQDGDEGVGPVTIEMALTDVKIPEGLKYQISMVGTEEEFTGLALRLADSEEEQYSFDVRVREDYGDTHSREKVFDRLMKRINPDTHPKGFEPAEFTILDDVSVGDFNFKAVHEEGGSVNLNQTYYIDCRENEEGRALTLELEEDEKKPNPLSISDSRIVEMLENMTLK